MACRRMTIAGMPSAETTLAFLAAALLLGYTPGPDNLFVLMQSLARAQTRVRVAPDGGSTWIDGPFAEAKEFVGGFFLLQHCSRDEAMAWAAECPAAAWATVEVRELGPCFT